MTTKPANIIADYSPPAVPGWEWECQCARCGSSCEYEHCCDCEDGYSDHDCGEDCCCCLEPELNVVCETCHGHGGWYCCLSSPEWCRDNPLPGREEGQGRVIEWFAVEE